MKEIAWTVALIICTALLILHCGSIIVSVTSKELKKSRFLMLTLYLSLSDSAVGFEFIYISVLNFLSVQLNGAAYLYQCMLIKHIISGTFVSSVFQTLILCVERYNATFLIRKKALKKFTSDRMVVIGFVVLSVCPFLIALRNDPEPCDIRYTLTLPFVLSDIMLLIFLLITIVLYTATMIRISKALKEVKSQGSDGINNPDTTGNGTSNSVNKRRHNMTLGAIIVVSCISLLPRNMMGLYVFATGDLKSVEGFMWFANNVLLILCPLLDPVIYVLRLKKYREILKKKCCFCRSSAVAPSVVTGTD